MFDVLVGGAGTARGVAAVGGWARVENAACARRLGAIYAVLGARLAAEGSAEREQWVIDNWDAVAAEVAAAQNISPGAASHQLSIAQALAERLPKVNAVFTAGAVGLRLVEAIVYRTALVKDRQARAAVDAEIAAAVAGWGSLSVAHTQVAIDYWVDRIDPGALRRTESRARDRGVDVHDPKDGSGLAYVEAVLYAHDAASVDARLNALAATVCDQDPRTFEQRRGDGFIAALNGSAQLRCRCADPDCPAAGTVAAPVIIHVVANQDSLCDDTPVRLDGAQAPGPTREELLSMTVTEALSDPPPHDAPPPDTTEPAPEPTAPDTPNPHPAEPAPPRGRARCGPAAIIGGAILPAPLVAATLAHTARIEPIIHPGDARPEPRYRPSTMLATFVRCRDMTCRFPGCTKPAYRCDLDHTIAYPYGPTQASNLACLCREHHLRKTFWGWRDRQSPDGTIVWTSPQGRTYTTHPGSRLLFPTLCRPTAPVVAIEVPAEQPSRGLMMPRRTHTRTQARTKRIEELRRLNDNHVTERNKPPPF